MGAVTAHQGPRTHFLRSSKSVASAIRPSFLDGRRGSFFGADNLSLLTPTQLPLHPIPAMIVRIEIDASPAGDFDYRVTHESELLFSDAGLASLSECLVAAIEGLPPAAVAIEVWYQGIVSGTYPLTVVAMNLEQVAVHAANTAAAIQEVLAG